jgi:hypothetical protein
MAARAQHNRVADERFGRDPVEDAHTAPVVGTD